MTKQEDTSNDSPIWMRRSHSEDEGDRFSRRGDAAYEAARAKVLEAHSRWLQTNGREGVRLNLSRQDLTGAFLSGVKLDYAALTDASFKSAQISGSDLHAASLTGCKFTDAAMTGTDLSGADLTGSKFDNARLSYVGLVGSKIRGASVVRKSKDR